MTHDELRQFLRREPFQPFRIYVSDGQAYEIRHRRGNLLAEKYIKVGIPAPDLKPPCVDHTEFVWLKDVVRAELLSSDSTVPT